MPQAEHKLPHTQQNLPAQHSNAAVLLEKYAKGDERSAPSGRSVSPRPCVPASWRPGASSRPPAQAWLPR